MAAEVEADEEGVSAREGDGEWRPRRREGGVAGAGEWRMGGGDPGGEDGGGGAVMRVIGGDESAVERSGREQGGFGLDLELPIEALSKRTKKAGPIATYFRDGPIEKIGPNKE